MQDDYFAGNPICMPWANSKLFINGFEVLDMSTEGKSMVKYYP